MSLKTKLVMAITSLVFLIAATLSLVYLHQLLKAAVQQSYDTNILVARQIRYALQLALESGLKDRVVNPNDPEQLRNLAASAVRDNAALTAVVNAVNRYSPTVYDISIGDSEGRTLLTTGETAADQPLPQRPNYERLRDGDAVTLLRTVFGPPRVFDIVLPIDRNGQPFVSVRVGVRTSLLRALYQPWITAAISLMGLALGTALVVAFLLGNLALSPMEELSQRLDYWTQSGEAGTGKQTDAVQRVTHKIEQIGQRMRSVEDVFSALKENVNQVLGNLQDGLLLFAGDGRVVLVSTAATRFLQQPQEALLGRHAEEIFDHTTKLGEVMRHAWDHGTTLIQQEVMTETGTRLVVSLDFIAGGGSERGFGALLTLHDQESVEALESELEVSRRLSAIGRLTSGVGHEVKNPINAIVVHLELLRTKLGEADSGAGRHLEVIDAEIRRLDRVVQMLVDFSRPVEVHLVEQDLREVVTEVVNLTGEELSRREVHLRYQMPAVALTARIDVDLMKQALLNVIQNGAQAMAHGGNLDVFLAEEEKMAVLRIRDEGMGIPVEMQEKIFNLYYTTKKNGSGIGLAMTYRILQLHHGDIRVQSETGRGTEFQMRIPLVPQDRGRRQPPSVMLEIAKG